MAFSIFPRTVYKIKSKISGEVVVKEQFGKYTLHVQDLIQSGGIIKEIWGKAFQRVQGEFSILNCLVLGLGGGTVVQLIKACSPKAKIVSVEIDPEIIKIGKKFFGLGEIRNLEVVNADAIKWVADYDESYHRSRFDLVLVDLYIGGKFPKEATTNEFLKRLKKLLSKNGKVIFNRLISPGEDLAGFEEKLKKHFSFLEMIKTHTNLFFLARS
mgnify:CR=1 FL=1